MIFIVIPVFNRKSFTRNCLLSLREQKFKSFQIVIVDDGSTDGTGQMLASEFPEVEVIKTKGDQFWTASINLGIKYALDQEADYILTTNNDTTFDPDFLQNMMKQSEKEPHALLGALEIDSTTQKPHYGGEIIDWIRDDSQFLLDKLGVEEQKGLHAVSLYPGRGLLIPREVFEKIGLFEEKLLPHYLADYDFTLQAKAAGFPVLCNYDARVFTYPEESGDFNNRASRSFQGYWGHLFGIKGGGNLKNFTIYVFRNCPKKYVLFALLSGYSRRILGYWLK